MGRRARRTACHRMYHGMQHLERCVRLFQSSQFFAQSRTITYPKTYSKRSGFATVGDLLAALQWGDPANFELEGEFKICKAPRVQNLQRPDQIEHSGPFPHRICSCPNTLREQRAAQSRRTSSIPAVRRKVQILKFKICRVQNLHKPAARTKMGSITFSNATPSIRLSMRRVGGLIFQRYNFLSKIFRLGSSKFADLALGQFKICTQPHPRMTAPESGFGGTDFLYHIQRAPDNS